MKKGKIILAGAGPGDPELVTVRVARYLQEADVIIIDRLASPELLEAYASPAASILYVGKEGAARDSTPQSAINDLLVRSYAADKLVVRLKGGDVAFFSNVLDELQTLVVHNIPFEIVPGITAASGASACAGIPLTARGYASGVRFLTYYQTHQWSADYWQQLATTDDTLVFYMSSRQLRTIAVRLLKHGAAPGKALAVIEQATTPFQQVHTFCLRDLARHTGRYTSPSLVILGDVVQLHELFDWKGTGQPGSYFDPVLLNN